VDENQLASFGQGVDALILGRDLSRGRAREYWRQVIANEQPELQQGAFLAALAAKGETAAEIAGAFEAIHEFDTERVDLSHVPRLVDNSGTGRDGFKTFNVSTAAAVIAAASGARLARHGARAITSRVGTVDVLEALGIDVECDVQLVKRSIEDVGIGLFNGMSQRVHPRALFRVLSQIRFGSTLHLAGSLANPARPRRAVRGVYSPALVETTAETMRVIGFERALVCCGQDHTGTASIDELSTLGETALAELHPDGSIARTRLAPEDLGIRRPKPQEIASAGGVEDAARMVIDALSPEGSRARRDIACLNAAAILYVADIAHDLAGGLALARAALSSGRALERLRQWIAHQNRDPDQGLNRLEEVLR